MKVQSLSIVVPPKAKGKCINNCGFCVSRMHHEQYQNLMDPGSPNYHEAQRDYIRRMEFARDNDCNTVMLTGRIEPQQNREFLQTFGTLNANLEKPFRWIEMQTTGAGIDKPYLKFLRNHVGVSTISISLSSFDVHTNQLYNGTTDKLKVDLRRLCAQIKDSELNFNLRLSVNLTDSFNHWTPQQILQHAKNELGADQITFRVLYKTTNDENQYTEQDRWIEEHKIRDGVLEEIQSYIIHQGTILDRLESGSIRYSVAGLSTVLDDNCMDKHKESKINQSEKMKEAVRYLILQTNCKLYTKWDDEASLLF
ncbi:MAG: radical SAM protein [Thermoclostridium sp.]|nr:radical SAM protein [Thermoclostridium sp.]